MERIAAPVIHELIWRKVVASFTSKVVDQMADNALNSVQNIADFEFVFENLKKNLKSLSAKATDVEEEMTNLEVSGRKKRKREVEERLEQVESIKQVIIELGSQTESEGFVMRLTDGGKAAQLNERVGMLVEQSRNFGELVLDVRTTSGDTFLTEGLVGQAFNKNLETVLRLLESREVSSIGVYGMGGVGKTTLAKHINNRFLQQSEGRSVFWVTVSQEFTVTILQDKIARILGVDLSDEDEVGKRAMRLHRALSEKKNSVLILDDVWENIDMKKVGCLFGVDGCKLVITTRSLEVCRRIGCQEEIPVEKLHEGEAWMLFKETLGIQELDLEVEGIAKSMAKLCDGLPLGIITVAGSMRGKRGSHRWRNAFLELQDCIKGKDGMGEDEVFKVLKFSFDRLKKRNNKSNGFNMKQLCFMYCSLYPEDYKIGREVLVGKFISEGLVSERKSRRARVDEGNSILDELVNLYLLEGGVSVDGFEFVKMHDLVRSMALKICEGKYMVRAGHYSLEEIPNEEEWTQSLEKVSSMVSNLSRIADGVSPDCPNLGNREFSVIPDSFFPIMPGLCTLDLRGTDIRVLPISVSYLTSLEVLLLESCKKLENVPYLGNLKALRVLNLSSTAIKEVPAGVDELLHLGFLSMNARGLKMLPRGLLLKLVHLEHLNIPLHIQVSTEEIENLKQLEEFGGGVKSVSDFNKFIRSRAHDPCYRILVSKKDVESLILEMRWPRAPNNNELELHKCDLKDEKVLGKGIVHLTISECEGLSKWVVDDLSERFDNPTSLKKLDIGGCGGIEWIMRRSDGQGLSSTLEEIELWGLNDLKGVVMVMERERGGIGGFASAAVFSPLRSLVISKCKKMKNVGLPVSALPNLEEIIIWDCEELEEIFQEDEGIAAASTLPKLKYLVLEDLPRLKRVSKATIISNSIQKISIFNSPELMNKLPLGFDDPAPPPSLEYIWVEREWWESLEWDNPLLPQLLHPFLDFNIYEDEDEDEEGDED